MTRPEDFLKEVAEIIEQRGKTHGDFSKSMEITAHMWSLFLKQHITPEQVCVLFALLKISRMATGGISTEHVEDLVGYGAILGALVERR